MAGKYEINMCEGALFPKILRCAFPMMIANLLQLLYHSVDMIIVGRFSGEAALAAVGSTSSIINLIVTLLSGISVGTSIVASQYIGAKDDKKTFDTVHTSMLVSVISGIVFAFIGYFLAEPMLVLTGSPDNVFHQALLYLRIFFFGTPGFIIGNFGSSLMRSVGDTKRPLYVFSFSSILNAILNLVFVIKFNMGVAGVALATIISQYASAFIIVYLMAKTDGLIKLYINKLKIKKYILIDILKKGLPVGVQGLIFGSSNVIIQSSINSFGSVVMAGNTAAANIEDYLYFTLNTFCHASTIVVGQNFGAKKYERIDKTILICSGLVILIGVAVILCTIPFERTLLGIYAPGNETAISYGILRFKYILHVYFLCGLMELFIGSIRGLGITLVPMLVSVAGVVGVRIVWIYTVFASYRTLDSLYISYPISWAVSIFILIVCYIVVRNKMLKSKESR